MEICVAGLLHWVMSVKLTCLRYCTLRKLKKLDREVIPVTTIDRPPTAELEEDQTDEENLPADYPILSPLVDALVEKTANSR